ncbi:MAG: hypothetical protein RIQ52_1045 [Pseudomonadota bacterium]
MASSVLLSPLTRHQWARLAGHFEACSYRKGDVIQQAGDRVHAFHQFSHDAPALQFDPSTGHHESGHACGEECLAGLSHYIFTVVASGDMQGWKLSAATAKNIGKENSQIQSAAMVNLANRFREMPEPETQQKAAPQKRETQLPMFKSLGWLIAIFAPPILYVWLQFMGLTPSMAIFMAIMFEVILLWFFSLVDQFIPPIIGIAAAIFTGLVPAETALAGFASSSFVDLLCVLVISSVVMSSGLSFRLLLTFMARCPQKLSWQLQIPLFLGFTISPIIPSNNSRMALLIPVMNEIASLMRLTRFPLAATSMLAGGYSASVIFSNMLPSSKATNIALAGVLPPQIHAEFSGFFWFQSAAIVTMGMVLIHLLLTLWLFRTEDAAPVQRQMIHEGQRILGQLSFEESIAAIAIFILIIGTMTYEYHHIPTSSISGLLLFSLLSLGLISKTGFRKDIDWPLIFFLIGGQCLIRIAENLGINELILVSMSGVSGWIQGDPWRFVTAVTVVIIPMRFLLPGPPSALLATTIFNPVAIDNHINPWVSLFVCGFLSDIWFMSYQSGTWTQTQSMPVAGLLDISKFNRYNLYMNIGRLFLVYLCIPYWQWLLIL